MKPKEVILAIDPGTLLMGFAVVAIHNNKPVLVTMDVLKLSAKKDVYLRLQLIHAKVSELIAAHKPTTFAIEAPFFGKNVQSMLKLGRAQGVAIATAMSAGIEVTEYSPKKIKLSITGNGNADKEQIWKMLQRLLQLEERPKSFDATDALAVALCHFYEAQSPLPSMPKKKNSWEDWVRMNKERVR